MRKMDMSNKQEASQTTLIKKIIVCCLVVYVMIAILFPLLAGEQLSLKKSRNTIKMPAATNGTIELYAGTCIDQQFVSQMDLLTSVSVQWGTYYRQNSGTVVMELYSMETKELLLTQHFDMASIPEGGLTTLTFEKPLSDVRGEQLLLRVSSPDSQPGSAVSPLMTTQVMENSLLFFNNVPQQIAGTLCFSADGFDTIWFGEHYWPLAALCLVILSIVLFIAYKKYAQGKTSYLFSVFFAIQHYKFLIRQLVARDFKTKYKRSVLGMFWSFLNPLLMMSVQYFIFSTIFESDIPNYAAYLLIGIVCFNFFSEACNMSLYSILGNAALITKVYIPKYIYPVTRVLSSVVNLGISLIPLIIVCVLTGVEFHLSALLSVAFLVCLVLFSLGVGLLLSAAMVFFRDTQFLWSVFSMVWMYATAIFYPESILPEQFRFVLDINPLYHIIRSIRICILNGISPEPAAYATCFCTALAMLILGAFVFKKTQDKFVFYL